MMSGLVNQGFRMMDVSAKIVRDPIHEYVSFTENERQVIDSPWFQRLRHCSQNGPARLVYPSLLGTRFEHSLGVMQFASRIFDSVIDRGKYKQSGVVDQFLEICRRDLRVFLGRRSGSSEESLVDDVRQLLRMAALCHDIGHFPLSHTCERAFRENFWSAAIPKYLPARACHEVLGAEIVRHIFQEEQLLSRWLGRGVILVMLSPHGLAVQYRRRALPLSETVFPALNAIIMGNYDADRLDYLQRDGYLSGSAFGRFDVQRFIDAMALAEKEVGGEARGVGGDSGRARNLYSVVPTTRALSTVEAALLERYKLYKWVYFHHKALYYDQLTCELGAKLLAQKGVVDKLFVPYRSPVGGPLPYREAVFNALQSPAVPIPPLVLFRGRALRLGGGYFRLNLGFFVSNTDTHFFDDVWFCSKGRKRGRTRSGTDNTNTLEALVERKPCGVTVWKDWSQFETFFSICGGLARKSGDLKRKVDTDNFDRHVDRWLGGIWDLMRHGDFPEKLAPIILRGLTERLQVDGMRKLRPLMRIADWSLFGALQENEILGRTGGKSLLVSHSALLRGLSGLRGEIPFYVFVTGSASDILAAKKRKGLQDRLLKTIARGFINEIIENLERFQELKDVWAKAVREGS